MTAYTSYREVIEAFPDYIVLAIETIGNGPKGQKRVQKWHERDWIPANYWLSVANAAKKYRLFGITIKVLAQIAEGRAPNTAHRSTKSGR